MRDAIPPTSESVEEECAALNEQALALFRERQFKEAAELQHHVTKKYMDAFGDDDIRVWNAMKQLAVMISEDGGEHEAVGILREVLDKAREMYGDKANPNTVAVMQNLMGALSKIGEYQEAAATAAEVAAMKSQLYGAEHHETLQSLRYQAGQLYRADDFEKAAEIQRSTLETRKRTQGECLYTLLAQRELALSLTALGRYDEAEALGIDLIAMSRRVLGDTDLTTITCITDMAKAYSKQHKFEKAVELEQEAVHCSKTYFGKDHVETATALSNLASSLRSMGKLKEASKLQKQVIKIRKKALGAKHPDTIAAEKAL